MKSSILKTYIDFGKIFSILSDLEEIGEKINNIDYNTIEDRKFNKIKKRSKYKKIINDIIKQEYKKNKKHIKKLSRKNLYSLDYVNGISSDNIFLTDFYKKEYKMIIDNFWGYRRINFNIFKTKEIKNRFNLNELEYIILTKFVNEGYDEMFNLGKNKKISMPREIRVSLLISKLFWEYFENELHGACFDDKEALHVLEELITNDYRKINGEWKEIEQTEKEKDNSRLHSEIMSIGISLNDTYENFSKKEKKLYDKIKKILENN